MAWYLRKSVRLGPIRFNLSKSGIGTSVGVKGFRIGVRPNGQSYLHAGRHGLYYRQELNSKSSNGGKAPSKVELTPSDPDTVHYKSASSQELNPRSRSELLSKLNQSYTGFRLDYLAGGITLILAITLLYQSTLLGVVSLLLGSVITIAIAVWESKRRTVNILYSFEDSKATTYKQIISAFNHLASNKNIWAVVTSRSLRSNLESKRNAGASDLISRADVKVGSGKPPWVNTNIEVPVVNARSQTLYMMPDGILVYDSKGVGFVEYKEVSVSTDTTNYIEPHPPSDAVIVDYTWRYPNKNGGPDRRYKDNCQIPVCFYGELQIMSKGGMFLNLMTSKHQSPELFKDDFLDLFKKKGPLPIKYINTSDTTQTPRPNAPS